MKRPSYREAVSWIALNDCAGELDALDPETVSFYISTTLVADLFGVDQRKVGQDVVEARKKHP